MGIRWNQAVSNVIICNYGIFDYFRCWIQSFASFQSFLYPASSGDFLVQSANPRSHHRSSSLRRHGVVQQLPFLGEWRNTSEIISGTGISHPSSLWKFSQSFISFDILPKSSKSFIFMLFISVYFCLFLFRSTRWFILGGTWGNQRKPPNKREEKLRFVGVASSDEFLQ